MNFKSCLQSLTVFFFIIMIAGFVADKAGLFGEPSPEEIQPVLSNPSHMSVNTSYKDRIKLKGQEEIMFSSSKSSAIFQRPLIIFYENTTTANSTN